MNRCLICQGVLFSEKTNHTRCGRNLYGAANPPRFDLNPVVMESTASGMVRDRVALTGVQKKIDLSPGRFRFILKPPAGDFAALAENEALTLNLARSFGIPVVPHGLVLLASGELAYITRRIDRTADGKKIPMEDLCQLSGRSAEDKYEGSLEQAGEIVARYSTNPLYDLLRFFELNCFAFMTGNNDMHLKNISMIMDKGQVRLAPAYDLLNSRLVTLEDEDPDESALSINGKYDRFDRTDFILFGRYLGLSARQMDRTLKHLSGREGGVIRLIETSFLPEPLQQDYIHIYRERVLRLNG
jgi:serine/threonine-protein kinase HipA